MGETIALLVELGRDIDEVNTHTQILSVCLLPLYPKFQFKGFSGYILHSCDMFMSWCVKEFEVEDSEGLCRCLKGLATDGNKHRAKNDRRKQRSIFREVLHYIEVCSIVQPY